MQITIFISSCIFYNIHYIDLRNLKFSKHVHTYRNQGVKQESLFRYMGSSPCPNLQKKRSYNVTTLITKFNQVHTNALTHSDQWWKLIYNSVSEQRGFIITGLNDTFLPEYQHFISFVLCMVPMINLCLIKRVVLNNFFIRFLIHS